MVNLELINNLWLQIDKVHLSYLQTEESLQRIEQKKKLEVYMREYLCMVASNQRFYFATTKDVLYTSILRRNIPTANFSLSKFCHAWEMLGMYAANLIGQPWRKEFKEIRLYSGAYKYQIGQQLVGAEEILKQMGYTFDVEFDRLIVQGMLDYDRLVLVSRDCLLAKVESQILSEIHVALRTCSWSDIFEYRDQYVGTVSHCVRGLMYQFHQKKSMMQYQYTMAPIGPHEVYPTSVPYHNYPYPLSPELYGMPYLPMPVDEPDPKHQFLDLDSFERPQPVPGPVSKVVKSVPKFDCNFDIDRLEQLCYEDLDFSDGVPERKSMKEKTATTPNREYAEEPRDYRNFIQIQNSATNASTREESKGYHELTRIEGASNHSHIKTTGEESRSYRELIQIDGTTNNPHMRSPGEESRGHHELIQIESASNNIHNRLTGEESRGHRQLVQIQGAPKMKSTGEVSRSLRELIQIEGWECLSCTYVNGEASEICDMCAKSRHRGPECQPLLRGGRECAQCTLVNPPEQVECQACSTSLNHAPTYI